MKLSKTTIIAATFLGALALTGVGFAGWQIVSNASETHNGNITVYNITNNAVVISGQEWKNKANNNDKIDKPDVVFGKPANTATANVSSSWLSVDSTVNNECFPVYSFTLTDYSGSSTQPTVTATLSLSVGDSTDSTQEQKLLEAYYTCQHSISGSKTYIAGPELVGKKSGDQETYEKTSANITLNVGTGSTTSDGKGKAYTVTIDLGFGWGTNFMPAGEGAAVNPYYYYNNIKQTDENVVNAQTAMSAINDLSGLTYTLTITATPASSSTNS